MADTQLDADPRAHAAAAAHAAAERTGVVVRPLETLSELEMGSELIMRIWNDDGEPKAPVNLLRALSHAGDFVAGAFRGDRLVGISLGFFGLADSELHLHSHITGIDPEFQGRSLGFALKQFQRSWALERGAHVIEWTADPLVRANVFFNLAKLGAAIVAYHENFYGSLQDGLNGTSESDRVVVRWDLTSERAIRAADGAPAAAADANQEIVVRAFIPDDIVRIRKEDASVADAWRKKLREAIGPALRDGCRAESMTRDGWLVLTR